MLAALLMPAAAAHALPRATAHSRMNVVLILTDDQTLESISRMPYLSSRSDWTRFTSAFDNVSLCCPARATILTGQYDAHTGVLSNEGTASAAGFREGNTLPVWLHDAGYATALVGKYFNGYPFKRPVYTPPGWSEWDAYAGPASYYTYDLDRNGRIESHGSAPADYATDVFTRIADRFLATARPPFFLHFSPHTPHYPYVPSPSHLADVPSGPVQHDASFNEADVSDKPAFIRALTPRRAAVMDRERRLSWAMNLSVDDAIRRFDRTLAARGLLKSTVEIFMTDNAYAFGEHRWLHKRCEYDVCMRIPMMMRVPGVPGRRVPRLVSTIDVAPTIADVAGVAPKLATDGRSLLPLVKGTAGPWRNVLLEHWGGGGPVVLGNPPNFCAVRTNRYRYVRLQTGETELYDEQADPAELHNLARTPADDAITGSLQARLDAYKRAGDCDESLSPPAAAYVEEP
jgi:arylsulfatase A-like enzyme